MVNPKLKKATTGDDDIDSYLEAQLIADIKSSKTREVAKPLFGKAAKPAVTKKAPAEEMYESIVEDPQLPDNWFQL